MERKLWHTARHVRWQPDVCFPLAHLPVFLIQQRPPQVIAAVAVMLTLAGVFGGVLYLRTGNLFTVIGIHALYNSPLPVVEWWSARGRWHPVSSWSWGFCSRW
jgi:membrane protease YdiL (CAAX protease family)